MRQTSGYKFKIGTKIRCIKPIQGEYRKGYFTMQPGREATLIKNPKKGCTTLVWRFKKRDGKEGDFAYWDGDEESYKVLSSRTIFIEIIKDFRANASFPTLT